MPRPRRALLGLTLAVTAVVIGAIPAEAHVTVQPAEAEQGGFATLAFQVPNESDEAGTTSVEVTFPEEYPLPFVSVKPTPGWTFQTEERQLEEPVEVEGTEVTQAVGTITWQAGRINPGEFQQFLVSVGPLPEVESLSFPAIQTYDDGEVARWIEPTPEGGEEPEFPAPTLTLTPPDEGDGDGEPSEAAADTTTTAPASTPEVAAADVTESDVDDARALGIAGIVVGVIGILIALAAVLIRRRRAV
jgi:uncharacterized protein YcnI